MKEKNYAKAYKEVLEIISYLSEEEYSKIPKEKIDFFKLNCDSSYDFKLNPELSLENQNISTEANAILTTIFRDYFATEKQKNILKKLLAQNQEIKELKKKEKYNIDVFHNRNSVQKEDIPPQNSIIEYKENFFIKFIKNLLKRFRSTSK